MNPDWLSNTYLVAASRAARASSSTPAGRSTPLIAGRRARRHHADARAADPPPPRPRRRAGRRSSSAGPTLQVLDPPGERSRSTGATGELEPGRRSWRSAALEVTPLHTPGHTDGMLSLLVDGNVFTGDTLFKNSVGGVRAPGSHELRGPQALDHGRAARAPARDRPSAPATPTRRRSPRSGRPTRSCASGAALDPEGDEPCTALGEPATLVLLGDDYDGGHKAWVRWPDGARRHRPGLARERASVGAGMASETGGQARRAAGSSGPRRS